MSVDESGMGSPEPKRRAKVLGILRDTLRQKSMGCIEELPEILINGLAHLPIMRFHHPRQLRSRSSIDAKS